MLYKSNIIDDLFTLVLVVHDWWFIFLLYFSYFSILTDSFWIYNMKQLKIDY